MDQAMGAPPSHARYTDSRRNCHPPKCARPIERKPFSSLVDTTQLSKALTQLLRHGALQQGIQLTTDGFADWDQMRATLPQFAYVEFSTVERIVKQCSKQRFMLKTDPTSGKRLIRCNQGHSFPLGVIAAEQLLTPLTLKDVHRYPFVVHGCPLAAWELIKFTGLNRMGRQHIHMAVGLPKSGGVVSGMRASSAITIEVDLVKALTAGIPFFVSENGVILSPGVHTSGVIPTAFFKKVVDRRSGRVLPTGGREGGSASSGHQGPAASSELRIGSLQTLRQTVKPPPSAFRATALAAEGGWGDPTCASSRTKLCRDFAKGRCTRGGACQFLHKSTTDPVIDRTTVLDNPFKMGIEGRNEPQPGMEHKGDGGWYDD